MINKKTNFVFLFPNIKKKKHNTRVKCVLQTAILRKNIITQFIIGQPTKIATSNKLKGKLKN